MDVIARGQPRAKLDDTGSVIELRVPTGDREKIVFDLTINHAMVLQQYLQRAVIAFYETQKAAKDWRAENVIPLSRARRA